MRIRRSVVIALSSFGAIVLLFASVCVVPNVPMSVKLRSALSELDLPEGDVQYELIHAPPLLAYDMTGDHASTLIHYPGRGPSDVIDEATQRLEAQGWTFQTYDNERWGQRDGWSLTMRSGRWSEEGFGCCVKTDDPSRPVGLSVGLRPG